MDWRITHVESIDSTMNWARSRVQAGAPEGAVIIADKQSGGRGRRGNTWESPVGNLYMTFIVKPDETQMRALPFLCALAIDQAMQRPDDIRLKWPNDILYRGRKMAGVLIEREGDMALCGVGVNVASAPEGGAKVTDFQASIKPALLVRKILQSFTPLYKDPTDWKKNWTARAAFINERVTFIQATPKMMGVFDGIDDNGLAIIRDETGQVKHYSSGEVREVRHVISD